MSPVNKEIAQGAAWMVAFKLLDRGIGLISTIVLARLLAPADFGLVAMAMTLIAALQLMFAFSFDVHLIQNPASGRPEFDTVWTFGVLFNSLIAAVLAASAHMMAGFYHEPKLEAIIYVLAIGNAIFGLSNVGPVMFRRDMRFDKEFRFLLGKRLAPVMTTIPFALYYENYWALIIGQLTGTVVSVVLSYYMSSYRPRFSLEKRSQLFHASKWLVVNNIVIFFNNRAPDFLIGKLGGAGGLGLYAISNEISTLPTTEIVAPINRAAFPGYARLAQDLAMLRDSFLSVISMIALFTIPAGFGIVMVADLMVPVVLGAKWIAAVPLIQILAIYGVLVALQTNIGYVYLATGRQRLITLVCGLQLGIMVGLMFPAVKMYGVIGAAWACLGAAVIMVPINQALVYHQLKLPLRRYMGNLWRPLVAGAAMVVAIDSLKTGLQLAFPAHPAGVALLLCIVCGALTYAAVLYGLWLVSGRPESAERVCLGQFEKSLGRFGLKFRLT